MSDKRMTRAFWLIVGAGLIYALLALPNHPGTMRWSALTRFPLEWPVLLFGMLALGLRRGVPALLALMLVGATFIKLADYGMFMAYNRTFNPILDTFLIGAGISLLSDSIGRVQAILCVIAAVVAVILLFFALLHGLRAWARVTLAAPLRLGAAGIAVLFAGLTVADAGHHLRYWRFDASPPGTAWTSRLTFKRMVAMQSTLGDLADFAKAARVDPYRDATGLFDLIGERDVILIYLESYGRTSFENPLYIDTHLTTLRNAEGPLQEAGFAIKSGWLTSPTEGGQSWLAHGSLASGLWASDHGRYGAMLASGRKWLFHFAQDAGFRTATVMPAITLGWPESSVMGFEVIRPAADIPYKGDRFNWVTMPDQFTLSVYEELLGDDPRPDFIQIALISSHAPWVPIPPVLPWDQIGDGTIFNTYANQGPTPRELWKNRDDVRDQYRIAIDYTLQATLEHVAMRGDDAPLVMVVGDHQPAGFVSQIDSRDVAMHVIAPPEVMTHIESWGWTTGMIPDPDLPSVRMDAFRDLFIETFTSQTQLAAAQ